MTHSAEIDATCLLNEDCIAGRDHEGGCRFPSWHSADYDAPDELSVLREFWHTFWEEVTTVECACGMSAYEHEDMHRLEIAQDKVSAFYDSRVIPPGDPNPECPGDCGLCATGYTCQDRRPRVIPPGGTDDE